MSEMDEMPEEEIVDATPATSWYGRTCVKCNLPIHYSYTSEIEGYCGRCTDAVRKHVIESHRADLERGLLGAKLPERSSGGLGRLLLGLLLGGVLVFFGALATAVYKPELWEKLVTSMKHLLGGS